MSILLDSLEYFDKNTEKYENFRQQIKYIKCTRENDGFLYIYLYDKDKNLLHDSKFTIISSCYDNEIWNWAWNMPLIIFKKNDISIIKKILLWTLDYTNYSVFEDINDDQIEKKKNFFDTLSIKSFFTTSKFIINHPFEIEFCLSVVSYLSKIKFIFEINNLILIDLGKILDIDIIKNNPDSLKFYIFVHDDPII